MLWYLLPINYSGGLNHNDFIGKLNASCFTPVFDLSYLTQHRHAIVLAILFSLILNVHESVSQLIPYTKNIREEYELWYDTSIKILYLPRNDHNILFLSNSNSVTIITEWASFNDHNFRKITKNKGQKVCFMSHDDSVDKYTSLQLRDLPKMQLLWLNWQGWSEFGLEEERAHAWHDDVIKWKHFPRYWPFVRGIHRSPAQRPVTRRFGVFFDLRLNKRFSKQSWGWWFETPPRPLWRHCNGTRP